MKPQALFKAKKETTQMKYTALLIIIFALFIIIGCGDNSKQLEDLGHDATVLDLETPTIDNWKTGGEGYEITLDNKIAASGKQSLRFRCVGEPFSLAPAFAALTIPVELVRGKRIRFSAQLKTKDLEKSCQLWIRADKGVDPLEVKDLQGRGPKETFDWNRYTIEMDIPQEATSVSLGAVMDGKGTAWMDDLEISTLPLNGVKPVRIAGTVTDQKGQAVADALVALNWSFRSVADAVTRTDEKGSFSFTRPRGLYDLTAVAPGFCGGAIDSDNYQEDKTHLEIKLGNPEGKETVLLQGNVVIKDKTGDMPAETYVTALSGGSIYSRLFYSPVNSDGSFRMVIPEGKFTVLTVQSPGTICRSLTIRTNKPGPLKLEAVEAAAAPAEVTEWLKTNALPIKTPVAGNGLEDLMPLKKIIGNARIVALGEATHGTREIFQMKHRMLEFLVTEMDFTVFALEGSWGEVLAVNDYVLNGKGNPDRALAGVMFWTWNTKEVLAMIQWIRNYNLDPAHEKKVKFYGVDMQFTKESIRRLTAYLKTIDPKCLTQLLPSFIHLGDDNAYFNIPKFAAAEVKALLKSFESALEQFDKNKEQYIALSSEFQWRENRHHVRVLQQFAIMALADVNTTEENSDTRDKFMAENTLWISDNEPPGTKVVLWAHNGHIQAISNNESSMVQGCYLRNALGKQYFTIGFLINRGSYQARDYTAPFFPLLLREVSLPPAPTGSYGAAMAAAGFPDFFLDLRNVPQKDSVRAWFEAPHIQRWVGAIQLGQGMDNSIAPLLGAFDAVIFLDKTSRARPNPMGRRPSYPF